MTTTSWFDKLRDTYDSNEEYLKELLEFSPQDSFSISRAEKRKRILLLNLRIRELLIERRSKRDD